MDMVVVMFWQVVRSMAKITMLQWKIMMSVGCKLTDGVALLNAVVETSALLAEGMLKYSSTRQVEEGSKMGTK